MRDKGTVTFGLRELELAERKGRFKSLFQHGKGVKDLIEIAKTCDCVTTRVSDLMEKERSISIMPKSLSRVRASSFLTTEVIAKTAQALDKMVAEGKN